MVKNLHAIQETWVQPVGQEYPLQKGMATHSSILAWRSPWTSRLAYGFAEVDTTDRLRLSLFLKHIF